MEYMDEDDRKRLETEELIANGQRLLEKSSDLFKKLSAYELNCELIEDIMLALYKQETSDNEKVQRITKLIVAYMEVVSDGKVN